MDVVENNTKGRFTSPHKSIGDRCKDQGRLSNLRQYPLCLKRFTKRLVPKTFGDAKNKPCIIPTGDRVTVSSFEAAWVINSSQITRRSPRRSQFYRRQWAIELLPSDAVSIVHRHPELGIVGNPVRRSLSDYHLFFVGSVLAWLELIRD